MCTSSFSSWVVSPDQGRKGERKVHESREEAGAGWGVEEAGVVNSFGTHVVVKSVGLQAERPLPQLSS